MVGQLSRDLRVEGRLFEDELVEDLDAPQGRIRGGDRSTGLSIMPSRTARRRASAEDSAAL
jgi:hypothetical protein